MIRVVYGKNCIGQEVPMFSYLDSSAKVYHVKTGQPVRVHSFGELMDLLSTGDYTEKEDLSPSEVFEEYREHRQRTKREENLRRWQRGEVDDVDSDDAMALIEERELNPEHFRQ